ncbi:MAG TPA: hypothetical protein VF521_13305 [Pyrinomonadaceae bacterium]|jgi:hypothetical protein
MSEEKDNLIRMGGMLEHTFKVTPGQLAGAVEGLLSKYLSPCPSFNNLKIDGEGRVLNAPTSTTWSNPKAHALIEAAYVIRGAEAPRFPGQRAALLDDLILFLVETDRDFGERMGKGWRERANMLHRRAAQAGLVTKKGGES